MKSVMLISRIFVGLVFIFSGFVKAIDPTGFAIKLEEYFVAFHLDFMIVTALPLAVFFCVAEMMIGFNLLAKLRVNFTAWVLILFMAYFTLLTFILAITNPVSDCGCFGDAVKLTNWQTFWKNIILGVPTLVIFIYRKQFPRLSSCLAEWSLTSFNVVMPLLLSLYCLMHEPLLDFRPYKTGTHIPDKMVIPDGAPLDKYETILVYQKNGLQKEFTETDFPWKDTTWKWVETRQKLISKGYEPPIHDFSVTTLQGTDITEQVLSDNHYILLVIAPKLEKASLKGLHRMNELAMKADNLGFVVYCLTSSASSQINEFQNSFRPVFELCTTDETTLKTILRANPGLLILHNGTILGKWNYRDAPDVNELSSNPLSFLFDSHRSSDEKIKVLILAFALLLFYSLVFRFLPSRSGS